MSAASKSAKNAHDDDDNDNDSNDDDDGDQSNSILRITEATARSPYIEQVWRDTKRNYYVAVEWNANFYATLAYQGFVSVAQDPFLLPEMQFTYGVLLLDKVHVEKAVKKKSKHYHFVMDRHFDEVIERVNKHHTNSWVIAKYKALLKVMHSAGAVALRVGGVSTTFQVHSPELVDSEGNLVAGELGYRIGNTYTSLTGFFDSSSKLPTGQLKHTSAGKIQLVALGKLLRRCGFTMWNLGHPPNLVTGVMRYKSEIGGEVLPRKQFLELWRQARDVNTAQPLVTPPEGLSARELIDHVF
eukprot:c12046_g1_i2.p1 GENE.c12046_g1_i2~~c12046_g1_i2.p1  ORF type:complete len:319 (+),score=73.95 c12046_g1_i2:62-958(+)